MSVTWVSLLLQCRRCSSTRNIIRDTSVEAEPDICAGLYWPHVPERLIEVRRVEITPPGDSA